MMVWRLIWRSLANRRATALLTVLAVAASVALLLAVEKVRTGARESFADTISGTDLIMGARAGDVQLLLYSVFRIGNATANVTWQSYQDIAARPEVAWTVPISLGDSHRGVRVLGTENSYFEHYRYRRGQPLQFAAGGPLRDLFDAVLGAEAAEQLGYQVGDPIVVSHGVGEVSFADHGDKPFWVAGILARTGTPVECERPLRVQTTRGYGYYVETSLYRGKDCVDSHARVNMDIMDRLVIDLLRKIRLPETWQRDIERLIQNMDIVRKIENRRLEIEDELRRAGRAFADGAFNEEEYDRRRKKLIAEKDSLVVPDGAKAIEMGMQLETIGDFMVDATAEEKYKILHILFDSVYYDFRQKRLVRFKPHADFVPIFRLAAPISGWKEKDGFVFSVTNRIC
jgi:hypothetical protein